MLTSTVTLPADIENLSTIKAKKVATGRGVVASNPDPLATLKAQLSQQDAKLEQLAGAKLSLWTRLLSLDLHAPLCVRGRGRF